MGNWICIENQMSDFERNNQRVVENKEDGHAKANKKSMEDLNCRDGIERIGNTYERCIHKHSNKQSLAWNSVSEKDEAQSSSSKSKVLPI